MKRKEWLFGYTAAKLADASTIKRDFHKERLEWWEKQKAVVMDNVRTKGIEVHDSVGAQYSSQSNRTIGYGAEIQVDAGMQRDLNECHSKINTHADLVKQYSGWIQVFNAHKDDKLELDHDDFLFFYEK